VEKEIPTKTITCVYDPSFLSDLINPKIYTFVRVRVV